MLKLYCFCSAPLPAKFLAVHVCGIHVTQVLTEKQEKSQKRATKLVTAVNKVKHDERLKT